MDGGSVTVGIDSNGQPLFSGSGLAREWATATVNAALAALPPLPVVGDTSPPYRPEQPVSQQDRDLAIKARRELVKDKARDANAVAPVLVAFIQANADIDLTAITAKVEGVSVGRMSNPLAVNAPIQPPQAAVQLPLVGTARIR